MNIVPMLLVFSRKGTDKHFPNFAFKNPLRRILYPPEKIFKPYLKKGDRVADLGCGPGYYTIPMARFVLPDGSVYAVDSNARCIHAIDKKVKKNHIDNIETHNTSAHSLPLIRDDSIDFILANGLLCSMAPENHSNAVVEFKRILKPDGLAYISVAKGSMSYVDKEEWEDILLKFKVIKREDGKRSSDDRWAVVSIKE
jgi:ubiquinone/menaquinone biosynthesis C-methylase UbiE